MIARREHLVVRLARAATRPRSFRHAEHGSIATEYGLIAALIVIAIIIAVTQVRDGLLGLPFPALISAFTKALSG